MIRDPLVADTYSDALFQECLKTKCLDRIQGDLKLFSDVLKKNKNFLRFLEGPQFLTEEKKGMIDRVFKTHIHELSLSFLHLLIMKKRMENFYDIQENFHECVLSYQGYVEVSVVSAVELSDGEADNLREKLSKITERKIRLEQKVKPYVLGGLLIKIGHKMIDSTLRHRLNEIKTRLGNVAVTMRISDCGMRN